MWVTKSTELTLYGKLANFRIYPGKTLRLVSSIGFPGKCLSSVMLASLLYGNQSVTLLFMLDNQIVKNCGFRFVGVTEFKYEHFLVERKFIIIGSLKLKLTIKICLNECCCGVLIKYRIVSSELTARVVFSRTNITFSRSIFKAVWLKVGLSKTSSKSYIKILLRMSCLTRSVCKIGSWIIIIYYWIKTVNN